MVWNRRNVEVEFVHANSLSGFLGEEDLEFLIDDKCGKGCTKAIQMHVSEQCKRSSRWECTAYTLKTVGKSKELSESWLRKDE